VVTAPVTQRIRLFAVGLFILGLIVQFYLAGRGVFGASSFSAHRDFGDVLHLLTPVILILTLVNRTTRNRVVFRRDLQAVRGLPA
jgi:hypothetical protein